jgi:8-oxo-dGTP pyrophosphatase MutT (NUDIX family)
MYNRVTPLQCSNCGMNGHIFRNCISPVTSYGIIAIKGLNRDIYHTNKTHITGKDSNSIKYLLIQRKDSLSFVEFIRGKYQPHQLEYIGTLLKGMTILEHEKLRTMQFDKLWESVWGEASKTHRSDFENSEKKYQLISDKIGELLDIYNTNWKEAEWGFPKGRRNTRESDIGCAIREFQEETNLKRGEFHLVQNTMPISETFFGSNNVHYCHKYYIGVCNDNIDVIMNKNNPHMTREIGDIRWLTLEEALSKIRPDNIEKREIILKTASILRNFCPVDTSDKRPTLKNKF